MAKRKIDSSLAKLLLLALNGDIMKTKIEEWDYELNEGEVTDEMLRVFVAMGWLTPRDPRVSKPTA